MVAGAFPASAYPVSDPSCYGFRRYEGVKFGRVATAHSPSQKRRPGFEPGMNATSAVLYNSAPTTFAHQYAAALL